MFCYHLSSNLMKMKNYSKIICLSGFFFYFRTDWLLSQWKSIKVLSEWWNRKNHDSEISDDRNNEATFLKPRWRFTHIDPHWPSPVCLRLRIGKYFWILLIVSKIRRFKISEECETLDKYFGPWRQWSIICLTLFSSSKVNYFKVDTKNLNSRIISRHCVMRRLPQRDEDELYYSGPGVFLPRHGRHLFTFQQVR